MNPMTARKYLIGESYGGFRVPRIASELQLSDNIGPSGLILISPYLDGHLLSPTGSENGGVSPMAALLRLPSMAAANLEAQGICSVAGTHEGSRRLCQWRVREFLA